MVLVGLVVVGLLGALWIVEALAGPAVRLPRRWTDRVGLVHPSRGLLVLLATAVAFTVLRNLL